MFWEAWGKLNAARAVVPTFDTPQGTEVVLWLLNSGGKSPLKDLYHSSRFSEPTVRSCLMRLVDQGFATVGTVTVNDQRQRSGRPTQKLLDALAGYRELFLKVAASEALEDLAIVTAEKESPADRFLIASKANETFPNSSSRIGIAGRSVT